MKTNEILSASILYSENGAKHLSRGIRRNYSFAIINCIDINLSLRFLNQPNIRNTNVYANIDFNKKYLYKGQLKTIEATFALMYDFIDAFIISSYSDLQEDIDPLLSLRMYNDEYRPIYLKVSDSVLLEELDEILSFAKGSNIDGLLIGNLRLLKYAAEKSEGYLDLIYDDVKDAVELSELIGLGIKKASVKIERFHFKSLLKARKIIRELGKNS